MKFAKHDMASCFNLTILKSALICLVLIVCASVVLCQDPSEFGNTAPPPTPPAAEEIVIEGDWTKVVRPSKIMDRVRDKFDESPNMSGKELAAFANELLREEGFDFTFSWTPRGRKNKANLEKLGNGYWPFFYLLTGTNGRTFDFYFMNDDFSHPCFSTIDIPVTKVSAGGFTVVSNQGKVDLFRPKDIATEEMVLVSKNLKKVIRKWKTPIDAVPLGISQDGTKIYFDSYLFHQDPEDAAAEKPIGLAIEISSTGLIRFVDVKSIPSDKGTELEQDKKYKEITYTKYKVKGKEYIVKYSTPCT